MSDKIGNEAKRVAFQVLTGQRPKFDHPLVAYVFDARGQLVERAEISDGQVVLPLPKGEIGKLRVFIVPADAAFETRKPTPESLLRLGAYEPVLQPGGGRLERIDIPGIIIDRWPFCFCWVRGRVVRQFDNRVVCDARVHICEVDRIPLLIAKLPDPDIYRLRDDLLEIFRNPPIPFPPPERVPGGIGPFPGPGPRPGPGPAPLSRAAFRFRGTGAELSGFDPQPDPPRGLAGSGSRMFNPGDLAALNPQPLPPKAAIELPPALLASLRSRSGTVLRGALIDNWKLLVPWFCLWPHWWWWFRCDELAVLATDSQGRFETTIFYPCGGDRPDLYFWVEYDFGSGFETVYHPPIGCHTYWDYACGTEITIRITDPRVPGCNEEPDLPGCQVVVLSIGPGVAVREVRTTGVEGVTNAGEPFGATLEPRVDFSRTELIDLRGIPYYRWSYRRLSGPDGSSTTIAAGSVPIGPWSVMTRDVYRHYKLGTSFPSDFMGPMPTMGPGAAPAPNLTRIRPLLPPAGNEWVVLNESIDLATGYFETASLHGAPTGAPPLPDDLAAGRYEIKLELFTAAGVLVNWTASGIDLRITAQDAPFGTGTVTTSPAPAYNRLLVGGDTMGFRMVMRVDNNRCSADILPVGGTVTPDPVCGFHNYNVPSDLAGLSFVARHPNNFATYAYSVTLGPGPTVPVTTSGTAGSAGTAGFTEIADFTYARDVVISVLLGPCDNAAYAERLDVWAMATNGYGTLTGYNSADNAAFALAVPCPTCPPGS